VAASGSEFITNKFCSHNRMCSKQMGLHAGFKLNMTRCAKVHGNQVGKRHFGPCPTKKVICDGRKQSVTEVGEKFFVLVL